MPRERRFTSSRGLMGPENVGNLEDTLSPKLRKRVELLKAGFDPDTGLPLDNQPKARRKSLQKTKKTNL